MVRSIADIVSELSADPWRTQRAFDAEFAVANEKLFGASADDAASVLREWLSRHQPCLFGRIAAKRDLLTFCILDEEDLTKRDDQIRDKIQAARLQWTKVGYEGRKSGFIVLAISKRVAEAEPNATLQEFARRLCQLYLLDECGPDQILLDEIYLERPGPQRSVWKWVTGVNVFSAAGDGRWWQDHRIPGGLGFSVNSVGHMVKSSQLSDWTAELDRIFGDDATEQFAQRVVDSLPKALDFAMRTISKATDTVSGKATMLLQDPGNLPVKCPVELSPSLKDKNYCEYAGYYHTDITIPSVYFRPEVQRPSAIERIILDFTYLFRNEVDNPAFHTMGAGRRVRGEAPEDKTARAVPKLVSIDGETRLRSALR
jgi:hypothetical protein